MKYLRPLLGLALAAAVALSPISAAADGFRGHGHRFGPKRPFAGHRFDHVRPFARHDPLLRLPNLHVNRGLPNLHVPQPFPHSRFSAPHVFFPHRHAPVWVAPGWVWNGFQWVWVPGFWSR
ncbi:MAG: hypothetical protein ACE147_20700 [Candidatus Methylomirabilales bacterium]